MSDSVLLEALSFVADSCANHIAGGHWNRATIAPCGDLLRAWFFGDPNGESCERFLTALAHPTVAPRLASIELGADDIGVNGTCSWDLRSLVAAGVEYRELRAFRVERGDPFRHNRLVLGEYGGEQGVLAHLLDIAPGVEILESPSALTPAFLDAPRDRLRLLCVDAGYDHAGFVRTLAERGSNLPSLEVLGFGDYCETYVDDWREQTTPRDDYVSLFTSPLFRRLRSFVWRNPPFDDTGVRTLLGDARGIVTVERTAKQYLHPE